MYFTCLLKAEKEYRLCLFGLHFDGNEFFFYEVWLLQRVCDCKYGLS